MKTKTLSESEKPKLRAKACGCGIIHFGPKQDFKIQEFPGQEPFIIFDCDCGSTISWPIDTRVRAMLLKRLERDAAICSQIAKGSR